MIFWWNNIKLTAASRLTKIQMGVLPNSLHVISNPCLLLQSLHWPFSKFHSSCSSKQGNSDQGRHEIGGSLFRGSLDLNNSTQKCHYCRKSNVESWYRKKHNVAQITITNQPVLFILSSQTSKKLSGFDSFDFQAFLQEENPKPDSETQFFWKKYYFVSICKIENSPANFQKRRAGFVLRPGLFFSPRNIKTQFSGNFNNLRLKKFPSNCVLMFLGLKKRPGLSTKAALLFLILASNFLSSK